MITVKNLQEAVFKLSSMDPKERVQFEENHERAVIKNAQGRVLVWISKTNSEVSNSVSHRV
jgi:hypothetical protein